jgi:Major intrinsic protein
VQTLTGEDAAAGQQDLAGKAALIASVGGQRGWADWTNPDHRLRRLLAEFIGMAGLTFVLSGGAAILARYGGHALQPWQTVLVLSAVSALWLVVAVYFLGDISAHFNPATTLAFALRRDMGWVMAGSTGSSSSPPPSAAPCWPAGSSGRPVTWPPPCPSPASPGRRPASRPSSPSAWCS